MKDGRFESAREMMQALIDGKKIANIGWRPSEFIYIDESGTVRDNRGAEFFPDLEFHHDYAIYLEPKKLKKVKLLGWINKDDGATFTAFDGAINESVKYLARCPSLDKEVEYEE